MKSEAGPGAPLPSPAAWLEEIPRPLPPGGVGRGRARLRAFRDAYPGHPSPTTWGADPPRRTAPPRADRNRAEGCAATPNRGCARRPPRLNPRQGFGSFAGRSKAIPELGKAGQQLRTFRTSRG